MTLNITTKANLITVTAKTIDDAADILANMLDTEALFRDMINECYPTVEIGYLKLDPADVLKKCSPLDFEIGVSEYKDDLTQDIIADLRNHEEYICGMEVEYI